ncbi:MAG TPA: ABC transporter permease [Candidatus Saccharimonadales bacterium]|nr:ABC transporter permease [Candidatus Saccharimonadales bacterium]
MMRLIRAELLKLFTVRTTYVTLAIGLILAAFFSFYVLGYRTTADVVSPDKIAGDLRLLIGQLVFFPGLLAALLVTNEYRYNTIMYTLTSATGRLKVFLAKLAVVSLFAVAVTLAFALIAGLLIHAGVAARGFDMAAQNIPYLDLLWKIAFSGWAYAMFALIFAFIIRNQIGAIVALLFLPGTIEGLLSLLLRENTKYLPFTALGNVLGVGGGMPQVAVLSPGKSALVVLAYVLGGLLIAALLFKRRDAS